MDVPTIDLPKADLGALRTAHNVMITTLDTANRRNFKNPMAVDHFFHCLEKALKKHQNASSSGVAG